MENLEKKIFEWRQLHSEDLNILRAKIDTPQKKDIFRAIAFSDCFGVARKILALRNIFGEEVYLLAKSRKCGMGISHSAFLSLAKKVLR